MNRVRLLEDGRVPVEVESIKMGRDGVPIDHERSCSKRVSDRAKRAGKATNCDHQKEQHSDLPQGHSNRRKDLQKLARD